MFAKGNRSLLSQQRLQSTQKLVRMRVANILAHVRIGIPQCVPQYCIDEPGRALLTKPPRLLDRFIDHRRVGNPFQKPEE
jgi:hypothetical protein